MARFFAGVVLLTILHMVYCSQNQDLHGMWLLKDDTGKYKDLSVYVPGGIYSDLMSNKIIDDIFVGYNDNATRWVPRTNWTYYMNFTVLPGILDYEQVNIVFEGLDTISKIYINDELVGESQNMFVRYIFDVKDILKEGDNSIEVRFESPIEAGERLAAEQSLPIPPDCVPDSYKGECHVNMLRKMQASFSWDWGPAFPSVGIWKTVYLEGYNETVIRYFNYHVVDQDDTWRILLDTEFANNKRQKVEGQLTVEIVFDDGRRTSVDAPVAVEPNDSGELVFSNSLDINKDLVKLWWPNGYGEQHRYFLTASFQDTKASEWSKKTLTMGFRTIELVQQNITSGLNFYFKVNGQPMFMKGSNEIPLDILPELGQLPTVILRALTAARDTHMNMLRVWGGGVYESDDFYDLCDEYGILIWQDFMFASAMYPADLAFLENVRQEVSHQVKRLRSHPCMAIFAGNNENEGNMASNYFHTDDNYTIFKDNYQKLYIDTIGGEFNRITKGNSIFVGSSPSNGLESIQEDNLAENPGDEFYGDKHYYQTGKDGFDPNIYPTPRFCSEYGTESLPSVDTLLTVTDNIDDLNINSAFMDHRQHKPNGNSQMKTLLNFEFDLPKEDSDNYYKAFIYYNQISQAMAMKVESEHYRMYRSRFDGEGKGGTMGALYWQLNDVWVAPSWAGIDYTGKWKMLTYFVQKFFAPIIITGAINTDRILEIYAVSDLLYDSIHQTAASIQVYRWDSFDPINTTYLPVELAGSASTNVTSIDVDNFLSSLDCGTTDTAKTNCFFYFQLLSTVDGSNRSPENFVLPDVLKNLNITTPNLEITSVILLSAAESTYEVTIKTDRIAAFVWLDTPNFPGRFAENGFIQVEPKKTVVFRSEKSISQDDLKKLMTVTSLRDKQYE